MQTVNASLLDAPDDFAIVQCISADCAMGITNSGRELPCLALTLRKKYPLMVDFCKTCKPVVGDVIVYYDPDGRTIFNLVTKSKYYEKPTYAAMMDVLWILRHKAFIYDDFKLAIPKLGSGLDKLDWDRVSKMIDLVFNGTGIEVVLYDPK